jgi:hypothetical protein
MRRIAAPLVLYAALVVACHNAPLPPAGSNGHSVITREQLEEAGTSNVYDVITRLHNEYLNDRGKTSVLSNTTSRAVVFMEDQEYGIIETLQNIPASRIQLIRYYTGIEAAAKFGSQYGGGVIQLIPRVE